MHKHYRLRRTELPGGEVRGRAQVAIWAAIARMPAHVITSWAACRSARSQCRCWWSRARWCTTRRTRVLTKASIRPEVVCPTAARQQHRNPLGAKDRQRCRCSLRLLLPPIRTIWPRITSSRKLPSTDAAFWRKILQFSIYSISNATFTCFAFIKNLFAEVKFENSPSTFFGKSRISVEFRNFRKFAIFSELRKFAQILQFSEFPIFS